MALFMPPRIRTKAEDGPLESERFLGLGKVMPVKLKMGNYGQNSPSSISIASTQETCSDQVCLSPLSQFFLNMPAAPDIYAVMQLRGYCRISDIVAPMTQLADMHDRFRRRLVYEFGAWHAEVLEDFDVSCMIREVTLPGPVASAAFEAFMSQLMSGPPLGEDGFPPWDMHLIHYVAAPQRTDLLLRASHVIGDGQLFMRLIKGVLTEAHKGEMEEGQQPIGPTTHEAVVVKKKLAPEDPELLSSEGKIPVGSSSTRSSRGSDTGSTSSSSIGSPPGSPTASSGVGSAAREGEVVEQQEQGQVEGADRAPEVAASSQQQQGATTGGEKGRGRHRKPWWRMLWGLLVQLWNSITALLYTMWCPLLPADPVGTIKAAPGECCGPRHWSSTTLPLEQFKGVSKALGVSINTLAVTCLSGGIARYNTNKETYARASSSSSGSGAQIGSRKVEQQGRGRASMRMCSMVDTRAMAGQLTGLGMEASNNFSFIGVPISTGPATHPLRRLAENAWALSWIRHSLAVPLAIRIPSIVQFLVRVPSWSVALILHCLPSKASIGFSNMRGPSSPLCLAGFPVERIYNGVQPNAFGMFVSLFSYNDGITFTNTCYASKTSEPGQLLQCIREEYQQLRQLALGQQEAAGADASEGPRPKQE